MAARGGGGSGRRLHKRVEVDSDLDADETSVTQPKKAPQRRRLRKKAAINDTSDSDRGTGQRAKAMAVDSSSSSSSESDKDDENNAFKPTKTKANTSWPKAFGKDERNPWSFFKRAPANVRSGNANALAEEQDDDEDDDDDLDGFIVGSDEDEPARARSRKGTKDSKKRVAFAVDGDGSSGGSGDEYAFQTKRRRTQERKLSSPDDDLPSVAELMNAPPAVLNSLVNRHNRRRKATRSPSSSPSSSRSPSPQTAELPSEFSLSAGKTQEDAFEVYIQYLASAAVDPTFIRNVLDDKDEYFLPAIERMDSDIGVVKGVCDSSAWRPRFRAALEQYPYMKESSGTSRGTDCEACSRQNHTATILLSLYGPPYDRETFDVKDAPDGNDEDTETVFYVGKHCAKKSQYYHWLHHCRLLLYQAVGHEILKLRQRHGPEEAVKTLINNEAFVRKLRSDYEMQKEKVVEFLSKN